MLTLDDLVRNGTMSTEIAAYLRDAIAQRRSFLVFARPRFAGKTTTTRAMLATLPRGAPVRVLGEDGDDPEALAREARGGYLVVPEVTTYAVAPGYVWGAPVRASFASATECGLALALHADDPATALEILRRNGVPPEHLARLGVLVHLRSLGDEQAPSGRRVAGVYELDGAAPRAVYRWDERADVFARSVGAG